jgi:uncharacterized membrane protein
MEKRDVTIDTLRGFALFTMVAANMAPYFLNEPHPFLFRFYGTFAAPLFILISGMMVAITTQTKGHDWKHFLIRGLLIVAVGALIDVVMWNILPFTTVDVLYLIGISLPIAYFFTRLNKSSQWLIVIIIFLATPVLQNIFGYSDYPTEFFLTGEQTIVVPNQTSILNHWLVDGWFPIFPWLGFSLLGVILGNLRLKYKKFEKNVILLGISILILGIIIWYFFPGKFLTRAGYSEVFYPPTIGYIMSAIGLILTLFSVVDYKPAIVAYKPLKALGESALFMYILHLALGRYIIAAIWPKGNFQSFLIMYIALIFFMILVAYGLRTLKSNWKNRPYIIRFLIGG